MTEDQPVLPTDEPPPPPPPAPPAPERFDLGSLFTFAFRDPKALSKFVIGSLMVVLIPLFGLGLLALLGFGVRTARGALRGDEHPMADWDDFGGVLLDGIKVFGVIAGYTLAAIVMGLALVAIGVFWALIGQSMGSPAVVATSVVGSLTSIFFLVFAALIAKALIPAGIVQLAATGRFTAAFRVSENVGPDSSQLRQLHRPAAEPDPVCVHRRSHGPPLSGRRYPGLLLGHDRRGSGDRPHRPPDGRPGGTGLSGAPAWSAGFSRHSGPQGRGRCVATRGALARAAEPSRPTRSVPPPACGGLCRLKPAFPAGGAITAVGSS